MNLFRTVWRLEVQGQGVGRVGFSKGLSPSLADGHLLSVASTGLSSVHVYPWCLFLFLKRFQGFPGGAVVESLPASAGDTGSSPGLGRSHMPQGN